jgi:hypothetical protein
MKVFVAGVSTESQYVKGLLSFRELHIGTNDEAVVHYGATGLAARKAVVNEFLRRREFDAILMLDLDMLHPKDLLARLREHDLDMVTGHYYRRQLTPMMSIAELSPDGTWPFVPYLDVPQSGLHEIACAGLGCVLIKREVIEAVADELPPFSHPFDNGPMNWLTGSELVIGPDKRFFSLARKLGYKFWLDADVRCGHALTLWLDDDIYEKLRDRSAQAWLLAGFWIDVLGRLGVNDKSIKLRLQTLSLEKEHLLAEFNATKEGKELEELQPIVLKLNEYDNRMAECRDWLTGIETTVRFPEAPADMLEKYEESRVQLDDAEDMAHARKDVTRSAAQAWVEVLDERK